MHAVARGAGLVDPTRVIVTLGNFATKFVLQTAQGITRMRGRTYPWHGRTVVPTFHPAAILRGGGILAAVPRVPRRLRTGSGDTRDAEP